MTRSSVKDLFRTVRNALGNIPAGNFAHDSGRDAVDELERRVSSGLAERLERVEQDIAEFKCAHVTNNFQVLSSSDQDAKSWEAIERWHVRSEYAVHALEVTIAGPFKPGGYYYARLPGGHSGNGNTRSDALAAAAQWCLAEMSAPVKP